MTDKVFAKEAWVETLQGVSGKYRVFVPVKEGDLHVFRLLEKETRPDFEYLNTRLSPKGLIYPQSERMFEYSLDEKDPEKNILKEDPKDYSPQAVVGIRPCDAHAFQIVKGNFDNPEFRDPWWVQHYESTTLVGLGCNEPCGTCFCTAMGGGPFDETGLDVLLYDLEETYLARGLTEKGEDFLSTAEGGNPADDASLQRAADLPKTAAKAMPEPQPVDPIRDKAINELFEAPFWEEVAFACLNCGTCTFLCPTCWCFDIQDEVQGKRGDRMRNWDSCMFPLFTLHGSGHNPREQKAQRVRQRFMHKLKYYVDKYDNGYQCSGCGRCVAYCPVNIDIREVLQLMRRNG
jgi:sulfhydrogenase subunit beta (sulfur reductase)